MLILVFASEEEQNKFELLFNQYRSLLLHKAYEILHDYTLAEDAASEAFLRIYKNLHKITVVESGQTASFCVTIVKNVALTMRTKEHQNLPLETIEQADEFQLEEQVLGAITSQEITRLLDDLGDDLKSVFLLKYAHDLSHREIASALNISENNVTVRLHRGKKKLKELLSKGEYAHV